MSHAVSRHSLSGLAPTGVPCPLDFTSCGCVCLRLVDTPYSYTEAQQQCAQMDAHLAVPRTSEQKQCVDSVASIEGSWLGITERGVDGVYFGEDGLGAVEVDPYWAQFQPDRPEGDNGLVVTPPMASYDEGWHDNGREEEWRPLCQLRDP